MKKSKYDNQNSGERPYKRGQKHLTFEETLLKLERYCVYQDRCINEVKQKLKQLNWQASEQDKIINRLIEKGFLDEQRFAQEFAKGKFHNNKWGKIKIRYELKKRQIPLNIISEALESIDATEYESILKKIIENKIKEYTKPLTESERQKLIRHLLLRGFEAETIMRMV